MYKWGFCVPDSSGNCYSLICYLLLQLTGKLLYLNTRNELPSTFSLKYKYSFKKRGVCFQKTFSTVELKLNRKRPTLNLYWSMIQRSKVLNYSKKNYNSFAQSINTVWQNTGIYCLCVALSLNLIHIFLNHIYSL